MTAAVAEAVATEVPEGTYVLGVRHHGPGSARGVLAELDRIVPDVVLVEGPADADSLVRFVAADGMEPPVALLAYDATTPARAVFWPYAVFSPEWQALRWAVDHGALARFVDLPSGAVLAHRPRSKPEEPAEPEEPHQPEEPDQPDADVATVVRSDPIALLAQAAGYDDPERWWDDVIESRSDGSGFEAITEAMASLRDEPDSRHTHRDEEHEARREAYMRTVLREVRKGGARRIVVVCGAWHAPALTDPLPTAAADARVLRRMPKTKTVMTWVPWTHSRLSYASGYGAGIESPGWYDHLFTTPDHVVTRWLTKVAGRLREKDLPVSSAHVIEAVRLAEAVATMRGRPLAGLAEVTDATRSVLCQGEELLVELVTRDVVVGERLGTVPDEAPTVPWRPTSGRRRGGCGSRWIRSRRRSSWTCANPTTSRGPDCCTGCAFSGSTGSPGAHDRNRDVQGGLVAGLAARTVRRRRGGQRMGHLGRRRGDRARRRPRHVQRQLAGDGDPGYGGLPAGRPRRGAATGARRSARPGGARRRRRAPHGGASGARERDAVWRRAVDRHHGARRGGDVAAGPDRGGAARRGDRAGRRRGGGTAGPRRGGARRDGADVGRPSGRVAGHPRTPDTAGRPARAARGPVRPTARRRAGVRRRGHGAGSSGRCRWARRRRRRPPGSRGSSPAEACFSSTTPRCSRRSTRGWLGCGRRSSSTCCRCCDAPSVGSSRPSVASWRTSCAGSTARIGVAARTTSEWSDADLARATPAVATVARLLGLPYPPEGDG